MWASSALSTSSGQFQMAREMYRLAFQDGLSLGQAVAQAKAVVSDPDVRRSWVFLGDPLTSFGAKPAPAESPAPPEETPPPPGETAPPPYSPPPPPGETPPPPEETPPPPEETPPPPEGITSSQFLVFPTSFDLKTPSLSESTSVSNRPASLHDTFVGIAIVNPNQTVNEVVLLDVDPQGEEKANFQLDAPLGANGQTVFLTTEMMNVDNGGISLLAQGREAPLEGLLMVGDKNMKMLDGIGGQLAEARELYFPIAREDSTASTLLFLFNPQKQDDANVLLKAFDAKGSLLREAALEIPANGTAMGTLGELFGGEFSLSQGFVELTSDVPIRGFQFEAGAQAFSALNGQIRTQTKRLLSPHFFVDQGGGTTQIQLLNLETNDVFVRLQAFDNDSNLLAAREFQLGPHTLFVGDIGQLLNFDVGTVKADVISGYLDLKITPAGAAGAFGAAASVLGSVSFTGNEGKFRSTLPMAVEGWTKALFPYFVQSVDLEVFTGLAILNGQTETAQVTVQAFNESGRLTAQAKFDLPAGKRVVDLLDSPSFFGDWFGQISGHLQVSSTVPVVTFVLFGDFASEFLASVEAQRQD